MLAAGRNVSCKLSTIYRNVILWKVSSRCFRGKIAKSPYSAMREISFSAGRFCARSSRLTVLWRSTAKLRTEYTPCACGTWPRATNKVSANVYLHAEMSLVSFARLLHLGVAAPVPVLRRAARVHDCVIEDGPGIDAQALGPLVIRLPRIPQGPR
jgi:hypothetical protein